MPVFEHHAPMPASQSALWAWHDSPEAFVRIMPEWERLTPVQLGSLEDGQQTRFKMRLGPLRPMWIAEHFDVKDGHAFSDRMVKGPFGRWDHEHRFDADGASSKVVDTVEWRLPFHLFSGWTAPITVMPRIRSMFRFRSDRVRSDLKRIEETAELPRRRVLVSGSTGLIGTQLCAFLFAAGHDVVRLLRKETVLPKHLADSEVVRWNDRSGEVLEGSFEGFDAVIHLAGAGIGDKRWSTARKALLRDSRIGPTRHLAKALASAEQPPEVFLSGSAIGVYGNRGDEVLTESSTRGEGFLCDMANAWEDAALPAQEAGIRLIHLRTGLVTTAAGGLLGKQLLPAKMGAGGPIRGGRQRLSWISMDDYVHAVHHLMMHTEADGPFNITAPNPVPQRTFAKVLGRVLRRPSFAPLPGFVVRIMFGEMGQELILEGQHVEPQRLLDLGFRFEHPELESCLRHTLGKVRAPSEDTMHTR
ncbi:MAG: TIGR01777 family oxidoreductase, partial [Candidatus Poseidoniaceae archaeon]